MRLERWARNLLIVQVILNIIILWTFGLLLYQQGQTAAAKARAISTQNARLIQENQQVLTTVIANQDTLVNLERRILIDVGKIRINCGRQGRMLRCVLIAPKPPPAQPRIIVVPTPVPSVSVSVSPSPSPSPCRPPHCRPRP